VLDSGESPAVVDQKLVHMGLSVDAAKGIVTSYSKVTAESQKSEGKSNMLGASAAVGLGVLTILFAPGSGGIYGGGLRIIVGGVHLFRGWRNTR
jgi:hypothetical protein